jgi:hypothetical protein
MTILLLLVALDIAMAAEPTHPQQQFTAEEREAIKKVVAWRDDKRCTIL